MASSVYAGFFTGSINHSSKATSSGQLVLNSQTLPLLDGRGVFDPKMARGGGDITIVDGQALLPENNINGGAVEILESSNNNGQVSIYVVRKGDTLSQIAQMFDVSVNTIAWANDLNKNKALREGSTLVILPISGIKHVVKSGDTLDSLAKKYKGEITEIAQFNNLELNTKLVAGTEIIIPNGQIVNQTNNIASSGKNNNSSKTTSGYYIRPIKGGVKTQGLHGYNGVDLASYAGADIYAAAAGTVVVAQSGGWNFGYGNYIVIKHSNGTQTLYAHLQSLNVKNGQSVSQGDVIGYMGSTGRSTGPHLHFEVRGATNPF